MIICDLMGYSYKLTKNVIGIMSGIEAIVMEVNGATVDTLIKGIEVQSFPVTIIIAMM